MKKILSLAVMGVMAICLTGCNQTIIDTNYTFDKVICDFGEYEIKEWTDYNGEQIQFKTKDGQIILSSTQRCYLVRD